MCAIYWNNIENYNDNKNQNYLILSVVAWDRSICCARELAFSIEIINRRIQKETKAPNEKGDHLISLLCFIIIDIGYWLGLVWYFVGVVGVEGTMTDFFYHHIRIQSINIHKYIYCVLRLRGCTLSTRAKSISPTKTIYILFEINVKLQFTRTHTHVQTSWVYFIFISGLFKMQKWNSIPNNQY